MQNEQAQTCLAPVTVDNDVFHNAYCDTPHYELRISFAPECGLEHPFYICDDQIIIVDEMNNDNGNFGNKELTLEEMSQLQDKGWRRHQLWKINSSPLQLSAKHWDCRESFHTWMDTRRAGTVLLAPDIGPKPRSFEEFQLLDGIVDELNAWIAGDYWMLSIVDATGHVVYSEVVVGSQNLNALALELAQLPRYDIPVAKVHAAIEKAMIK